MRWSLPFVLIAALAVAKDEPKVETPRLLGVEATGPLEIRIRYASPLDPPHVKALTDRLVGGTIPFQDLVLSQPGGVANPGGTKPIGRLHITGARASEDGRALLLATDPHPKQARYTIEGLDEKPSYTLSGVEMTWREAGTPEKAKWSGQAKTLMVRRPKDAPAAVENRALMEVLGRPGRLELRTTLLFPTGKEELLLEGTQPFEVTIAGDEIASRKVDETVHLAKTSLMSTGEPIDFLATITTGGSGRPFAFSVQQVRGIGNEPISESRLFLPWVPITATPPDKIPPAPFALEGGDSKKGEAVFRSEEAKCSACHSVGGRGGTIGPSLDALKGRDLAEVFHQIAEPSARIVPDYQTYSVARKNGELAVGVVRAEGFDAIRVSDIGAKSTLIPKVEIEELRPSATSTMPVGLPGALGEARMRDLLAFLTSKN